MQVTQISYIKDEEFLRFREKNILHTKPHFFIKKTVAKDDLPKKTSSSRLLIFFHVSINLLKNYTHQKIGNCFSLKEGS